MLSAAKLKLIRSLDRKKERDRHRAFMVEGEKMVMELLGGTPEEGYRILQLFATGDWIAANRQALHTSGVKTDEITLPELRKASSLTTPQPVMAMVEMPREEPGPGIPAHEPVLAFEAIRDPGNLGTIIRTANWFGIRTLVCSPDSVDLYNPKVVQSTMGALFRVKVLYLDLEEMLSNPALKEKQVLGTFMEGESIYETAMDSSPLVLFGNESRGLSEGLEKYLYKKITIPSFPAQGSGPESLNVASSVAIVCSELRRR